MTPCCTTARRRSLPRWRRCATSMTSSRWPTPTAAAPARSTRLGLPRLAGSHCYDVLAGSEAVAAALDEEPGTYFLTDFLARTFEHTVVRELGLDRWPELRDEYFRHYTRVMWLAQRPTPATRVCAQRAADRLGLPLVERPVGNAGLERSLEALLRLTPGAPATATRAADCRPILVHSPSSQNRSDRRTPPILASREPAAARSPRPAAWPHRPPASRCPRSARRHRASPCRTGRRRRACRRPSPPPRARGWR